MTTVVYKKDTTYYYTGEHFDSANPCIGAVKVGDEWAVHTWQGHLEIVKDGDLLCYSNWSNKAPLVLYYDVVRPYRLEGFEKMGK